MLNILDLAWRCIRESCENKRPITVSQCQKLLFMLNENYFLRNKKYLFEEMVEFKNGKPFYEKVYREFSVYSGMPIIPTNTDPNPKIGLDDSTLALIHLFSKTPYYDKTSIIDSLYLSYISNRKED